MKSKIALTIGVMTAVAIGAAVIEKVVVNSAEVTIREKDNNLSKKISSAAKGATLDVIEKKGDFLKVALAGKEGWIRKSDLEPRKIGKSTGSIIGSALAGDGSAGEMEDAGAGKGLLKGAEDYARSVGVDPKRVDAIRDRTKRIVDNGEYEKFAAEGKVGAR